MIEGLAGKHRFVVSKPICVASRTVLSRAFKELGFKGWYVSRDKWVSQGSKKETNIRRLSREYRQFAVVLVNKRAARWAEYVIASTHIFHMEEGLISQDNWNRGLSRSGVPMPWARKYRVNDGGTIERGCKPEDLPEDVSKEVFAKDRQILQRVITPAASFSFTSERTVSRSNGSGKRNRSKRPKKRRKRKRGAYRRFGG
jgi:hypothetical protein